METAAEPARLGPDVKGAGTEGLWEEGEGEGNEMNFTIIKKLPNRCVSLRGETSGPYSPTNNER